jgi:negative regulator of flagellin synthesis FlgM
MGIKGIGPQDNPFDRVRVRNEEEQRVRSEERGVNDPASGGDEVSISAASRLRVTAHMEAAKSSGLREDLVARLKAKVQSGEYAADGKAIAEGIVRDELGSWE